jgi:hypothetical protein
MLHYHIQWHYCTGVWRVITIIFTCGRAVWETTKITFFLLALAESGPHCTRENRFLGSTLFKSVVFLRFPQDFWLHTKNLNNVHTRRTGVSWLSNSRYGVRKFSCVTSTLAPLTVAYILHLNLYIALVGTFRLFKNSCTQRDPTEKTILWP